MRQIGNGLNGLFPLKIPDLINQDCKNQRCMESHKQIFNTQTQGIPECIPEGFIRNKLLEVTESNPVFTEDIRTSSVSSECDDVSKHRNILENDILENRNNRKRIQFPVLPDVSSKRLLMHKLLLFLFLSHFFTTFFVIFG